MNSLFKSLLLFLVLPFLFIFFTKTVAAGEGNFLLRSTTGESYRCYASSLLMQDRKYTILISCRDLIYPGDSDIVSYVVWAQPTEGNSPLKLGALGFGKVSFRSAKEFSSLFVTIEENQNTRKPGGQVVMRGNLETISFLQRLTTPTPTPEQGKEPQSGEEEVQKPVSTLSTKEKLVQALQRAGIAALFALVALIGLLFVITRSRG